MTDELTARASIPDAGAQYTVVSDEIWNLARRDYLSGQTAADVCLRYGIARSTLHFRAARDGWRRADQPPIERTPYLTIVGDEADTSMFDLVEMARLRLLHAIAHGRASEAGGWFKLMKTIDLDGYRFDAAPAEVARPHPLDSSETLDSNNG